MPLDPGSTPPDAGEYCRAIEAHLCRRNAGHLIRIAGPSFDLVCGWFNRGIPAQVAFRGIDRYVERQQAKPGRRRPVRVDFCDGDVLDAFDEWRRAVGVWSATTGPGEEASEDSARRASLPAHLERVIARLRSLRGGNALAEPALAAIVEELEAASARAKGLRGAEREQLRARLAELDAELLALARHRIDVEELSRLRREAEGELAPFRDRLTPASYEQALATCTDRLVRDLTQFPILRLD